MRSVYHRVLGLLIGGLALGSAASAQCPTPDRLDGGACCTAASPVVPKLLKFSQDALGICWKDCDVDLVQTCRAVFNPKLAPKPIGGGSSSRCGPQRTAFILRNAAGKLKWGGLLTALYSRTWLETNPAGDDIQVWRFLLHGDMRPYAAAGPSPCPVPPCSAAHGDRVRYSGYVDYARNCSSGALSFAWMLTHACDLFEHAAGFPRAGAFHPERAYTFVGPSASFVPGPLQPVEGGTSALEDVRRLRLPPPGVSGPTVCEFEDPLVFATVDPIQQTCVCNPPPGAPNQFLFGTVSVETVCGSVITTPGGPVLPGYLSMGIGSWTDATTYPGIEALRWNIGNYDYDDTCTGVTRNEVYLGVTTLRGYTATQVLTGGVPAALPLTFVDQANAIDLTSGAPLMNVPYASDRILNLNH